MQYKIRHYTRLILIPLLFLMLMTVLKITAYADTDGTELQITSQPDKLILQLGPEWSGLEFQLKTDAGVYPAPVVVDESGFLKMDLGGSKTYILSCIGSNEAAPAPTMMSETSFPEIPEIKGDDTENSGEVSLTQVKEGIPALHLIMFLGGLALATGGLLAMRYFNRSRKKSYYNDDSDEIL